MSDAPSDPPRPIQGANRPQVIANYLPQFHPTAENDAWWQRGFTEWSNVALAQPQWDGHEQPHLPGELGYYDLRLPESRERQAHLAFEHGVDAFCYYHYWFHGRRMLPHVFDEVLRTGRPDFPFCLAWANENWTRRWEAKEHEMLMAQTYSEADDLDHIRWLMNAFADDRYLRIDGRPLMLIYRVQAMPEPQRTFDRWRHECERHGVPAPFLVKFETHGNVEDPAIYGCDASAEFLPHCIHPLRRVFPKGADPGHVLYRYREVAEWSADRPATSWVRYPGVAPGWDNASRRQNGKILAFTERDPATYEWWLRRALERAQQADPSHPLVFINAWNEWAEGAHLEPDAHHGRAYLEANARAVLGSPRRSYPPGSAAETPDDEETLDDEVTPYDRLYFDLYDEHVALQRRHMQFMHTFERRVVAQTASLRAEMDQLRQDADRLAELLEKRQPQPKT